MPLYGPKFPLSKGNRDTFELYDDIKSQVNFYLKNLLMTSPGENISDPSYGVGLRRYLFEQNIEAVRDSISSEISTQVSQYLPFISIEGVAVNATARDIDSNSISVKLAYQIVGEDILQIFELETTPETTIGFY